MKTTTQLIVKEVEIFLRPLSEAAEDEDRLQQLFAALGFEDLTIGQVEAVQKELDQFVKKYNALVKRLEGDPTEESEESLAAILDVLSEAGEVLEAANKALQDALNSEELNVVIDDPLEVLKHLLRYLAVSYLQKDHPLFYHVSASLKVIRVEIKEDLLPIEEYNETLAFAKHAKLDTNQLEYLFGKPVSALKKEYLPEGSVDREYIENLERELIPLLVTFAHQLDLELNENDIPAIDVPAIPDDFPDLPESVSQTLTLTHEFDDDTTLGLRFAFVGSGERIQLAVTPIGGEGDPPPTFDSWALLVSLSSDLNASLQILYNEIDEELDSVVGELESWLKALPDRLVKLNELNENVDSIPDDFSDLPGSVSQTLTLTHEFDDDTTLGVRLAFVGSENSLALAVMPLKGEGALLGGEVDVSEGFDKSSWTLAFQLTSDVDAFVLTPDGVEPIGSGDEISGRLTAEGSVTKESASGEPVVSLGPADGTHLEVGEWGVESSLAAGDDDFEFDVATAARDAVVVIAAGGGDGFLTLVLPDDGLRGEFDLGFGWSTERDVYLLGSGGLEVDIPIHASLGEALSFDKLGLGIDPAKPREIPVLFVGTFGTKLGPVSAVVEDIGLSAELGFPEDEPGNLGPIDVTLGFEPPKGAGLSVDASAVVGGGYLEYDDDHERYAGALQLEVGNLTLDAIGLLTTKLPGDQDSFSLLVIITGEFPPVQLGFGFTLNAVGGLLGVNRSTQVEVLRSGVRNGTLRSVLFPRDPVGNAPQIISDLRRIFPPTADRHVFGPMARLGWGTPTLITAEIGVLLELPAPIRLVILGRISALLPDEKAPILELNMDALGVIDFGERTASVDASLYDSRVVAFTLTGDMAMRSNWGDDPGFGLSVGGFNPRFSPPPEFPELRRVTVDLGDGNNPRIRLEGYFAVTSNTAQVGAKIDLYAGAGKFSIQGYLGFDALFQFDPFRFVVDIFAGVALKAGKATIMSIDLSGTLAGPTPWHVKGKAKFKILFVSFKVSFDKKFGRSDDPAPLPPADVFGKLRSALAETGNWAAQVPDSDHSFVTLRDVDPAGNVLVHPLGGLSIRQQVVPLGVSIDTFGKATPAAFDEFRIENISVAGKKIEKTESVREQFAPAQFFELTDAEKLSKPGFEQYQAGLRVGNDLLDFIRKDSDETDLTVTTTLDYETTHIDAHSDAYGDEWEIIGLQAVAATALLDVGAVAKGQMRIAGAGTFDGDDRRVEVSEGGFVVASTVNLIHQTDDDDVLPSTPTTRMEAEQALDQYAAANPEAAGDLQVVAAHHARGVGGDGE